MNDEQPPKTNLPFSKERALKEVERMDALRMVGYAKNYEEANQQLDNQLTYERSGEDDPNSEGFLLRERLRSRTAEEIEALDINADGLAIHGTPLSQVESVLRGGFGYKGKDGVFKINRGVFYNLVGRPTQDSDGKKGKIGFGEGRVRYGHRVVFVTDIFKQLWPNNVNAELQFANPGGAVNGELLVEYIDDWGEETGYKGMRIGVDFWTNSQIDWRTYKSVPTSTRVLIPEFKPEEEENYDRAGTIKTYRMNHWVSKEGEDVAINHRAYRQLLSPNALNAIVVSNPDTGEHPDEEGKKPIQEIVDEIVQIQNSLYPKNEHIPIYSEDGQCLYNPLK